MKIKRKNVAATKTTASEVKHEIIKDSGDGAEEGGSSGDGLPSPLDRLKQALAEKERERTGGGKPGRGGSHKKERGSNKLKDALMGNSGPSGMHHGSSMVCGSQGGTPGASGLQDSAAHIKREPPTSVPDPYEFNAKLEDRMSAPMPVKKIKVEKVRKQFFCLKE